VPAASDEIARLTVVLNATFDRLAASYQQAMRFSADASHELKTPLALISITLESLLRRTDLPGDVQSEILAVHDDTSRLSTICQNLLLLSRADAGRLQLDRQHTELRAIIEAAMDDALILAEPNRITITAELPSDATGTLDSRCVTQILLNLLENAVKYNRHEGRVSVSLSLTPSDFIIRIANTGPGITAEHAAQIFERFFRGDDSRTDFGHGLGLSLSRELARAHGGDLVLESSNAEWTVFLLTLPRDGDKDATPQSAT
jgi:signal transduction histidine kinase